MAKSYEFNITRKSGTGKCPRQNKHSKEECYLNNIKKVERAA